MTHDFPDVHDRWVSKYRTPFAAARSEQTQPEDSIKQVYESLIRTTPAQSEEGR